VRGASGWFVTGVVAMSEKRAWIRSSAAGALGVGAGRWHLLGDDRLPWCGRDLQWASTASAQGWLPPVGQVCKRCLRAEARAARAAAKEERARHRAARRRARSRGAAGAGA